MVGPPGVLSYFYFSYLIYILKKLCIYSRIYKNIFMCIHLTVPKTWTHVWLVMGVIAILRTELQVREGDEITCTLQFWKASWRNRHFVVSTVRKNIPASAKKGKKYSFK